MLRSLSSAVSGLQAQQTEMDIIGNNIANVNTTGFRSSRASFTDLFYQTLDAGSEDTNPMQVGNGTQVASTDKIMTRVGATQTDRALDLYIDGDGYFGVQTKSGGALYTRVGNFHIDANGYLCDSAGNYILGTNEQTTTDAASGASTTTVSAGLPLNFESQNAVTELVTTDGETIPIDADQYKNLSITFSTDGTISGTLGGKTGTLYTAAVATADGAGNVDPTQLSNITYDSTAKTYSADYDGKKGVTVTIGAPQQMHVALFSFVNQDGLVEQGDSNYAAGKSSGAAACFLAGQGNTVELRSGSLEMSNVDIAREFTNMIVTERGYQSNARVITTSDEMLQELINLKRS